MVRLSPARRPRTGGTGGTDDLVAAPAGAVLLVSGPAGAPAAWHAAAARLPADPGRTVVAATVPGGTGTKTSREALARLLQGYGPLRLALPGTAAGRRCLAQVLADRLKVEVVAPAGDLVQARCGTLFAGTAPGEGRSGWYRFVPGGPAQPFGHRLPAPPWEPAVTARPAAGSQAVAEPVPSGLWLRPAGLPTEARASAWARAVAEAPCRPDRIAVFVGAPGTGAVPVEEVCQALAGMPPAAGAIVRLTSLGPVAGLGGQALGQVVADRLGGTVCVQPGLVPPGGHEPHHVNGAGQFSWRPFAIEVTYQPAGDGDAPPPLVERYRLPLPGTRPLGQARFGWNEHIVAEIVQSGLWIRTATEPAGATVERTSPADGEHAWILVGSAGTPVPAHLETAARDLVARLDEQTRSAVRLAFASIPDPGIPDPRIPGSGMAAAAWEEPVQDPAGQSHRAAVPPGLQGADHLVRHVQHLEPALSFRPPPEAPPVGDAPAPVPLHPWLGPWPEGPAIPQNAPTPSQPAAGKRAPEPWAPVERGPAESRPVQPASAQPAPAQPASAQPAPAQPASVQPASAQPASAQPASAQPAPAQPAPAQPASGGSASVGSASGGSASAGPAAPPAVPFDPKLLTRRYRSSPQERAWLRGTLGEHQERFAATIRRTVAQQPGLVLPLEDPEAAVTDLVAVHVYLSAADNTLDRRFRGGDLGHLRGYGGCLVSGLVRLPSYRGAASCDSLDSDDFDGELEPSATVISRIPLTATPASPPDHAHVLLWSATARHVERLDPRAATGARRVLFLPNTPFRVLDLSGPTGQRRIFLRETAPDERDPADRDAAVLAWLRASAGPLAAAGR